MLLGRARSHPLDSRDALDKDDGEDRSGSGGGKSRRKKGPGPGPGQDGFCGSSLCVVGTVVIVMAAIYFLLFVYIVHRGHRHRQNPNHHHGHHLPRRRTHDLSSLLMEGLPPLRKTKTKAKLKKTTKMKATATATAARGKKPTVDKKEVDNDDDDKDAADSATDVELSFALDGEEAVAGVGAQKPAELADFDPVQQVKELTYLRGRLPI